MFQRKCRPMKKHHFCGDSTNEQTIATAFEMLKRAQIKLVTSTRRFNCELHQLFCIIQGRKPQRKCERGSHHGDKVNVKSLIHSKNNVVHGGCTRAEDFCEATVCFTVVSLISQSNPEQMSPKCPPGLGTCPQMDENSPCVRLFQHAFCVFCNQTVCQQ